MLASFRQHVVDLLGDAGLVTADGRPVELWPTVPDDVTALPCLVVGKPSARPAREDAVYDLSLVVYVLARRVDAGGPESELVGLADAVWLLLGGTRGTRHGDTFLDVNSIDTRTVEVAGVEHEAYLFTIGAPITTCD